MPLVIKKEPIKSEKVLPKKVLSKESIVKKELPKKEVKTTSIPNIHYSTFGVALREAKVNKKIVLIKVHSNDCPYCDKLDKILATNRQVKELISKYYEMVEINNSYEFVPLNVMISTTPSFVFVRPRDKKVLMIVPGIQALGDLVEILKEGIEDGHNGGYLKP
jgi:thioredoxin-related protein